ncbi:hypothetical protein ABL78_4478 [Leptomonas seymouri]|uniref:Uncharacterized protein n=1 Tax=Leptomonas seymouri TaxID=5684 RepID=A0A0N0P5V9_LEPSE|nr:hypothetical protein ABL78_4478 [Leptomonas seymouri]|eukprot:KPI86447.1 hypothetical protein ABL78_4478 [Leptomonas seymouri]
METAATLIPCDEATAPQAVPESVAGASPSTRKRQRSGTPSGASFERASSLPERPSDGQLSAADAEMSAVKVGFAAAHWRRGCLRLQLDGAFATNGSPTVQRKRQARSDPPNGMKAERRSTASTLDALVRHLSPNPWKLLRAMEECGDTQSATTIASLLPKQPNISDYPSASANEPPVPVSPQMWNTYWETYSACCAEALEGLSTLLNAPAAGYRRVVLTLISTAVVAPLPADNAAGVLQPSLHVGGGTHHGATEAAAQKARSPAHLCSVGSLSSAPARKAEGTGCADGSACNILNPSRLSDAPSASHSRSVSPPTAKDTEQDVGDARPSGSRASSVSSSSYSYSSYYSYSSSASSYESSRGSSEVGDEATMKFPALSTVLDDFIFAQAHHFGAVERIETHHRSTVAGGTGYTFVSIQFTTEEAAGLFYRWADGLSIAHLVRSHWQGCRESRNAELPAESPNERPGAGGTGGNTVDPARDRSPVSLRGQIQSGTRTRKNEEEEDLWWAAFLEKVSDAQLEIVAKLAPHDPRVSTNRLLIGPNVMIATPLVTSLFTGLFRATRIDFFRALGGFLIDFTDVNECRLALHALQCSLKTVFGVTLIYW